MRGLRGEISQHPPPRYLPLFPGPSAPPVRPFLALEVRFHGLADDLRGGLFLLGCADANTAYQITREEVIDAFNLVHVEQDSPTSPCRPSAPPSRVTQKRRSALTRRTCRGAGPGRRPGSLLPHKPHLRWVSPMRAPDPPGPATGTDETRTLADEPPATGSPGPGRRVCAPAQTARTITEGVRRDGGSGSTPARPAVGSPR